MAFNDFHNLRWVVDGGAVLCPQDEVRRADRGRAMKQYQTHQSVYSTPHQNIKLRRHVQKRGQHSQVFFQHYVPGDDQKDTILQPKLLCLFDIPIVVVTDELLCITFPSQAQQPEKRYSGSQQKYLRARCCAEERGVLQRFSACPV